MPLNASFFYGKGESGFGNGTYPLQFRVLKQPATILSARGIDVRTFFLL